MRYRLLPTLAALLVAGAPALGQGALRPGITQTPRPAFSPYLNLTRPGASTAFNYYGLVRPEVSFRNSILGLQGQVDANTQAITTGTGATGQTGVLVTGHSAMFLNTGGYFLNLSGGSGGRGMIPGTGAMGGGIQGGAVGGALGGSTVGRGMSTAPSRGGSRR